MAAYVAGMVVEMTGSSRVILGFASGEIGLERRLRVDHDLPAARQMNDEVRPLPPVLAADRNLFLEVAVFEHAREFDDASQLEFPPATPDIRRAERLTESSGLALEFAM